MRTHPTRRPPRDARSSMEPMRTGQLHRQNALFAPGRTKKAGHVATFPLGAHRREPLHGRTELGEDVLEVGCDGSRCHDQGVGDLLVGTPVDQQTEHLHSPRQPGGRLRGEDDLPQQAVDGSSPLARTVTRTCPSGAWRPPRGHRNRVKISPSPMQEIATSTPAAPSASSASPSRPGCERNGSVQRARTGVSWCSRRRMTRGGGCLLQKSSVRCPKWRCPLSNSATPRASWRPAGMKHSPSAGLRPGRAGRTG